MKTSYPKNFGKKFFIFLLFFLVSTISVSALINESVVASYSFEDLPTEATSDDSGFNNDLILSSGYMTDSSHPKVNNVQIVTSNGTLYAYNKTINAINTTLWNALFNHTFSFWFYAYDGLDWYQPVSYGVEGEGALVISITPTGSIRVTYCSSDTCSFAYKIRFYETSGGVVGAGEWNYITVKARYNGGSPSVNIYHDTVEQNITSGSINIGGSSQNLANKNQSIKIGSAFYYSTTAYQAFNTSDSYGIMDQLIIYNTSISQDDINTLYNYGDGINPFDTETPSQIASFTPINITFTSQIDREYSSYYVGETYVELAFNYSEASYDLTYSGVSSTNTGDFAIQFISPTQIRYYGFSEVVYLNMTIRACNTNGCTEWFTPHVLSVGFTGEGVYGRASVADISLSQHETKYIPMSNYFYGYENIFFQFPHPDTLIITNVSLGYPNNNSCFYSGVIDDYVVLIGNNETCTVNYAYYIVDDGLNVVVSNPFAITVTATGAPTNTTSGGIVNSIENIFPDYQTIPFQTRMTYVLLVMGATLLIGVFFVFNAGAEFAPLITMGIGALILVEFIFFTAIKYIPIIWVVLFGLAVALIGVGWFTQKQVGGS